MAISVPDSPSVQGALKMHSRILTIVFLIGAVALSAQAHGIDVEAEGGVALASDAAAPAFAASAYWRFDRWGSLSPSAGLFLDYQRTSSGSHVENEGYVLASGTLDWDFCPLLANSSLSKLAAALSGKLLARVRLGLGYGYLGDEAETYQSTAVAGGLAIDPAAGLSYDIGIVKVGLMVGPRIFVSSVGAKSSLALSLGAIHHFDLQGAKK
jgi:hypothetical protein